MSRAEGFDVMDVSTAILHDPKLRRLSRDAPDQLTSAFMGYVATVAESWKAGERLAIEDAWPSYLPFDEAAVAALKAVKLLDERGRVLVKAWRGWFEVARERREKARERWRRANKGRHDEPAGSSTDNSAGTARAPRGNRADTAPIVPSVPNPNESTTPPNPPRKRGGPRNGRAKGLTDYDALMVSDDDAETPAWLRTEAKP